MTRPAPESPSADPRQSTLDHIAAIKARHPDYWVSEPANQEAVAAWGAEGQVNECGVFAGCRAEPVAKVGRAEARVGVHRVRDGVFVHCCNYTTATAGGGYLPSVWASVPHATEEAAREAGVAELLQRLGGAEIGLAAREEVRQLRAQLRRRTEQQSLI